MLKIGKIKTMTKKELYILMDKKRVEIGMSNNEYIFSPVNSIILADKYCKNLEIIYKNFKETKICGILYKGKETTSICLNSKRSTSGRNFDCMHELIHYWFHENELFMCADKESDYYEWEANEGAAQFLMPYQIYLPLFKRTRIKLLQKDKYLNTNELSNSICKELSTYFNVGTLAISVRMQGLSYELLQYEQGVSINNLDIKSATQLGINKSYS